MTNSEQPGQSEQSGNCEGSTVGEQQELPSCGWCNEPLESPALAIEHLDEEHGVDGPAAVSAVFDWEWPSGGEFGAE